MRDSGWAVELEGPDGPETRRYRRLVVVGAGNTGCDIAVDAALRADAAYHSTRRGYWYAPKYALGRPADQVSNLVVFATGDIAELEEALQEQLHGESADTEAVA